MTTILDNSGDNVDGMRILEDILEKICPHNLERDCIYLFSEYKLKPEVPNPLWHMSRNCHDNNYLKCKTYQEMEKKK